jgi:hypothetical protein
MRITETPYLPGWGGLLQLTGFYRLGRSRAAPPPSRFKAALFEECHPTSRVGLGSPAAMSAR